MVARRQNEILNDHFPGHGITDEFRALCPGYYYYYYYYYPTTTAAFTEKLCSGTSKPPTRPMSLVATT
jgi:hypothetical protein